MFGFGKASQQEVMMITHRFTKTEEILNAVSVRRPKNDPQFNEVAHIFISMRDKFRNEGIRKRDVQEVSNTLEMIALAYVEEAIS